MGFSLGKIGEMVGGIAGSVFGGPIGSALGSKAGGILGSLAADLFKNLPKPPEVIQQLLGVLAGGFKDGNITNVDIKNVLSDAKNRLNPMDYYQLENAVEELQHLLGEMSATANNLEKGGVQPPNGSDDWFMAIARALAKVVQDQANDVKEAADKVSTSAGEDDKTGVATTTGTAGAGATADTKAEGSNAAATPAATDAKDTKTPTQTEDPKENQQMSDQLILKAEAQRLEFLTTAVNTTIDKIAGALNSLGRAG